jgi:hypothetical protein
LDFDKDGKISKNDIIKFYEIYYLEALHDEMVDSEKKKFKYIENGNQFIYLDTNDENTLNYLLERSMGEHYNNNKKHDIGLYLKIFDLTLKKGLIKIGLSEAEVLKVNLL